MYSNDNFTHHLAVKDWLRTCRKQPTGILVDAYADIMAEHGIHTEDDAMKVLKEIYNKAGEEFLSQKQFTYYIDLILNGINIIDIDEMAYRVTNGEKVYIKECKKRMEEKGEQKIKNGDIPNILNDIILTTEPLKEMLENLY